MAAAVLTAAVILQPFSTSAGALGQIRSIAKSIISGEPKGSRGIASDGGCPERRRASGILFQTAYGRRAESISGAAERNCAREKEFYLTISDDDSIDRSYHAVLKDHPEIFWVHNREKNLQNYVFRQ